MENQNQDPVYRKLRLEMRARFGVQVQTVPPTR